MSKYTKNRQDILEVVLFAEKMFSGQFRKGATEVPKMDHLLEVAELVRISGGTIIEEAAAILHDVLEDTSTSPSEVEELAGKKVLDLVLELTDSPTLKKLPTQEKKECQAEKMRKSSIGARRIKLADQTSNLREMAKNPPVGWDAEKCRDYIHGSFCVAQKCRGISFLLDDLFKKAYEEASRIY